MLNKLLIHISLTYRTLSFSKNCCIPVPIPVSYPYSHPYLCIIGIHSLELPDASICMEESAVE